MTDGVDMFAFSLLKRDRPVVQFFNFYVTRVHVVNKSIPIRLPGFFQPRGAVSVLFMFYKTCKDKC